MCKKRGTNTRSGRSTKKNRFERSKRLEPQKAKNRENRLKKKGLLFAHCLIAGPLSLNRAETAALTPTNRGEMLSCISSANPGEVVALPTSCRIVAFALPQNQDEAITSSARRSVSVAPLLSQGKQL